MTQATARARQIEVDVEGYRGPVNVQIDGPTDGPVFIAVHGFSGSLRWWDPVAATLAEAYRVVRADLLGHGRTGGPAADAPLQARVLDAALEQLGVERATVAGHSFGADVAVELAETSPRIDRLMIVCQAPDYSDAHLPRARGLMTVPVVTPMIHRGAVALGRLLLRTGLLGASGKIDRALADQAIADFAALRSGMFGVIIAARRDRMATRPLDAQVRASGKPTLVVLGGQDHFYGDRSAGRYRAAGAEVIVLPDAGHSPLIDTPDAIVTIIRGFVPLR